jgi:hypothetical protein
MSQALTQAQHALIAHLWREGGYTPEMYPFRGRYVRCVVRSMTDAELLAVRNIGRKGLRALRSAYGEEEREYQDA